MNANALATVIAEDTYDAYSFLVYGRIQWRLIALWLLSRGFDAKQVEAILRSKHTRWAADCVSKSSGVTRKDFASYWVKYYGDKERAMREADELIRLS